MKTIKMMGILALMSSLMLLGFSVRTAVGAWSDQGSYMKTTDEGVVVDSPSSAYLNLDRDTKSYDCWLGFKSDDKYNWLIATGRTGPNSDLSFCSYAYNTWSTPLYIEYATGQIGIGTTDPYSALDVRSDDLGGYAARFINTHGTVNSNGILVQSGSSGSEGAGGLIDFQNDAGGYIGGIEFTGYTVIYNAFTGGHPASIPAEGNEKGYPYGTVMTLCETHSYPEKARQADYSVKPSCRPYDKAVFGIYAGSTAKQKDIHNILTIGDGHILVSKEGGNIEIGDYLTTASRNGHAMKQNDDLLHSYTVAKSQEPVQWEKEENNTKLIACTYHAQ